MNGRHRRKFLRHRRALGLPPGPVLPANSGTGRRAGEVSRGRTHLRVHTHFSQPQAPPGTPRSACTGAGVTCVSVCVKYMLPSSVAGACSLGTPPVLETLRVKGGKLKCVLCGRHSKVIFKCGVCIGEGLGEAPQNCHLLRHNGKSNGTPDLRGFLSSVTVTGRLPKTASPPSPVLSFTQTWIQVLWGETRQGKVGSKISRL